MFSSLPLVVQEKWLNCMPLGGAEEIFRCWKNSHPRIRRRRTTSFMIPQSMTTGTGHWLPAIDLLHTSILVNHPSLCHGLVKKCINLNSHMEVAHRSWWDASSQVADKCAVSLLSKAHPTLWCARQPFNGIGVNEDHCCPCLRQFAILHLASRSSQPMKAKATTLARLLDRTFS